MRRSIDPRAAQYFFLQRVRTRQPCTWDCGGGSGYLAAQGKSPRGQPVIQFQLNLRKSQTEDEIGNRVTWRDPDRNKVFEKTGPATWKTWLLASPSSLHATPQEPPSDCHRVHLQMTHFRFICSLHFLQEPTPCVTSLKLGPVLQLRCLNLLGLPELLLSAWMTFAGPPWTRPWFLQLETT